MAEGNRIPYFALCVASILTIYLALSSFEIQGMDETNSFFFGSQYFPELNFSNFALKEQLTTTVGNTGSVNSPHPVDFV